MSPRMTGAASTFFSQIHREYDDLIRRCVPRYDEMLGRLLVYLPERAERVLELGCGTGNFTTRLVERYAKADIVTVDASPEMAALASQRVGARVRTVVGRFEEIAFDDGAFDLVVSSISLHHVRDKQPIYENISRWLRPPGEFWFSDQLAGATERTHERNWSDWLAFCRENGRCTEAEISDLLEHAEVHDHYTPLPEHTRMLINASFAAESIDCVWRNNVWGIVGAQKR